MFGFEIRVYAKERSKGKLSLRGRGVGREEEGGKRSIGTSECTQRRSTHAVQFYVVVSQDNDPGGKRPLSRLPFFPVLYSLFLPCNDFLRVLFPRGDR